MIDLSDVYSVKELLRKNGFIFSKALGQNFLINPEVCPQMAEECGADGDTGVIEIGPGIGVLTAELARRAKKVAAIEIDKRLPAILKQTLSDFDNVKIIEGDVMKLDLDELIREEFGDCKKVAICANLPYYITSPIIMHILERRVNASSLTVMVQKEAAERLCAVPGTRAGGAVTLAVRYFSEPRLLFDVKRDSFIPAPKVDSAVIQLQIFGEPAVEVRNPEMLFRLIKAGFAQRRKTLINALSSGLGKPKEQIAELIEQAKINPTARAEELSLEQFAELSDWF